MVVGCLFPCEEMSTLHSSCVVVNNFFGYMSLLYSMLPHGSVVLSMDLMMVMCVYVCMCLCTICTYSGNFLWRSPWVQNICLGKKLAEVKYNGESNVLFV